jgi:protein-tyrosine phosphatase
VERYGAGTQYHHLSVVEDVVGRRERGQDDGSYVLSRYRHLLTGGAPSIRQAFAIFSQPERYPLVFHCVAGKDRTGVLAALLLTVLGVPDEQIVEDYHRTDLATHAWFARQRRLGQDPAEALADVPAVLFEAKPDTMRALLDVLRSEHGSTEGYLRGIGVTDEELDRIREVLLEPTGEDSVAKLR